MELKHRKDSVMLITCTHATGTHKIPLAMIGKAENPYCPLPYKSQKNAWNDRAPLSGGFKGHMRLALDDVMGRYKPVVPEYRYKVTQ